MLQSVIYEAIQPLNERFDKFELKIDQFEAFTRNKCIEVEEAYKDLAKIPKRSDLQRLEKEN